MMAFYELNDREIATMLCALRSRQDGTHGNYLEYHFDDYTPLSNGEIDDLCERLNMGPYPTTPYCEAT